LKQQTVSSLLSCRAEAAKVIFKATRSRFNEILKELGEPGNVKISTAQWSSDKRNLHVELVAKHADGLLVAEEYYLCSTEPLESIIHRQDRNDTMEQSKTYKLITNHYQYICSEMEKFKDKKIPRISQ
jgi:hypothetical protein